MKKNLLAALSLIACFTTFSQEEVNPALRNSRASEQSPAPTTAQPNQTPTKEVHKNTTVTISKRANRPQRVHNHAYYQEEIDKIDNNIAAIDQKIAHVNADAQEKLKAESNGWFQDMENIKSELLVKKNALLEKQAKL